jgi:acyl phosphate:glycerol-3-phosphate acyltransferase
MVSGILTAFALLSFYLCGAFPTGYLIAKRHGISIAQAGSGNVGATNVARVMGRRAGLYTLAGDVLKGWLAVWLAAAVAEPAFVPLAAVAAVAGHCYSIPGKLRGGKGVATALGAFLYLSPVSAAAGVAVFALAFLLLRYVSLASVAAALATPVPALISDLPNRTCLAMGLISLLVVLRHKDNLQRLCSGTEPRFSRTDGLAP